MKFKHRQLKNNTIDAWYCDFNLNSSNLDYYVSVLSKNEIERADRFKFKSDRNCYVITRAVLRILLASYSKKDPKSFQFKYTDFGKPYLETSNIPKFNVSHSGNMAALCFYNNCPLGIDIEKIKHDFNVQELAQNFFSKNEIKALTTEKVENQTRAFFRCWTRKEAFIKAEGSGLSFPLDKFTVSLQEDFNAELLETHWNSKARENWKLFSFVPSKGFIAAVAVKCLKATINYYNWDEL